MTIEASSKLYHASKVDNNHKSISKKTEILRRTKNSEEKILVYSYTDFKKKEVNTLASCKVKRFARPIS